jgi:hydrogenase-4 component B
MAIYAGLCAAVGLAPVLAAPVLDRVIACWMPLPVGSPVLPAVADLLPLKTLGLASLSLAAVIALAALAGIAAAPMLRRTVRRGLGTWDCGYAAPGPRMQYGGSSFAQPVVSLFSWLLKPRTRGNKVEGAFPRPAAMRRAVDDAVLDRLLVPAARFSLRRFAWIRRFQQGQTQQYLFYILAIMVLMLGALIPVGDLVARVFAR